MKTVVLDDDPTGTQSATGVRVLLECSEELLVEALREHDSVYVLTNSRAIDEQAAIALVARIRDEAIAAAERLGERVSFVLRGDSTLRGHVFAETEVLLGDASVMVFVPAFPDGGRRTVGGIHYVRVGELDVPAHETEYAADPVFPFATAVMADYVLDKSGRAAIGFGLDALRAGPDALADVLRGAPAGSVVVPDAESDDDIRIIAQAIRAARASGADLVVRSASPLAAELAGVASTGLMPTPLIAEPRPTLLACGSHTAGATAQLAAVERVWGPGAVIDTALALHDPIAAGSSAAERASRGIPSRGLAIVATERVRSDDHDTLDHGERVMTALTTAVRALVGDVEVVVSKGGITSADVARVGIGARSATVLGQVLPGVSVWQLEAYDGRELLYVVVPGNVGGADTIVDVLTALRVPVPASA